VFEQIADSEDVIARQPRERGPPASFAERRNLLRRAHAQFVKARVFQFLQLHFFCASD